MAFQKKCLGKMGDVAKEGRTILFVSHNLSAVQRLCHKGIYLESGQLRVWDNIAPVLEAYQQSATRAGADSAIEQSVVVKENEARFVKWRFLDSSTQLDYSCYSREHCRFSFTLVCRRHVTNAYIGFALWNLSGELILAASSLDNGSDYYTFDEGVHTLIVQVRLPIRAGAYQIDVSLNSHVDGGQLDRWLALPNLNVLPQLHSNLPEVWHGLLNEEVSFELSR